MLLIRLLHPHHWTRSLSWQQSSSINSGSWNWSVAGTPGGTWPPPQQKMPGRCPGQPGLHALPTAAERCWGAGVTVWSRGCSGFPTVVPWLASPGDSNEKRSEEKERKSSLAQRPKQRGASALHCLSFSVASGNEREACVSVVSF